MIKLNGQDSSANSSRLSRRYRCGLLGAASLGAAWAISGIGASYAANTLAESASAPVVRKISAEQYKLIISDAFGPSVKFGGRFEPDVRTQGLIAVGAGRASISAFGIEQFDSIGRSIASQVIDREHRDLFVPCKPLDARKPDDKCAEQFFKKVGKVLYRRPMTIAEIKSQVAVATTMATTLSDFYEGLGLSLAGMMISPQFLFRQQVVEADPDHAGSYRLDAYSKASQLSFFLWNSAPDHYLMAAAENGEIHTPKGLSKQLDRMLASKRLEAGVRALFSDMLAFDGLETLSKDAMIYPKFTPEAANEAQEQTLRTIVDVVINKRGDYRDVFTARKTFLTPNLGSIYGIPIAKTTPNLAPSDWTEYEYPENDPRSGILSQISFVALHSHPGRSSATLRGKALRELILCQRVPDPPAAVDFTVVQETSNPDFKTARQRLAAHATSPACAGCHKVMDPMGLAMESFDGAGSFRTSENGVKLDTTGVMDGKKFANSAELGTVIHDSPATSSCLVTRATSYALGRIPTAGEKNWMETLNKAFSRAGYRVPDLYRNIVTSPDFFRVSAPQTGQSASLAQ